MKFVIAPDKYKGSLSGWQFCEAAEGGIKRIFPNAIIIKKPLADGGDGTIEVVKHYLKASTITVQVHDPLFRTIEAPYLLSEDGKIAFIEMSEASGYKLLDKQEMNCMHTTSLGTGELIRDALEKGAEHIVLGIGGSATNDGGMGMAAALGFNFLNENGSEVKPVGSQLSSVATIHKEKVHPRLSKVKIQVACDVTNPLYGDNGAAKIYGPQKGASEEEVNLLDQGLRHFSGILYESFGVDVQNVPGSGAAGGMGAGALTFLGAELVSGVDLIMEMADFKSAIVNADWIITGEGRLDGQTLSGKTINGILNAAQQKNIPVAAFCGSVDLSIDDMQRLGLDYAVSILNTIGSLDEAKKQSHVNLEKAVFNFVNLLKNSK